MTSKPQTELERAKLTINTLQRLLKQKNVVPEEPENPNERQTHRTVCMCHPSFWKKFQSSCTKLGFKNASELLRGTMQDVIDAAKD